MTHQDLYRLIQTVQKNVRCPQCGEPYGVDQIQIRGVVDSIVFLELSCKSHMPLLATVAFSTKKKTRARSKKKAKVEKINPDDVLEAHMFLKDFRGSFEQIFSHPAQS